MPLRSRAGPPIATGEEGTRDVIAVPLIAGREESGCTGGGTTTGWAAVPAAGLRPCGGAGSGCGGITAPMALRDVTGAGTGRRVTAVGAAVRAGGGLAVTARCHSSIAGPCTGGAGSGSRPAGVSAAAGAVAARVLAAAPGAGLPGAWVPGP